VHWALTDRASPPVEAIKLSLADARRKRKEEDLDL